MKNNQHTCTLGHIAIAFLKRVSSNLCANSPVEKLSSEYKCGSCETCLHSLHTLDT
jgi:hypothetical protein